MDINRLKLDALRYFLDGCYFITLMINTPMSIRLPIKKVLEAIQNRSDEQAEGFIFIKEGGLYVEIDCNKITNISFM